MDNKTDSIHNDDMKEDSDCADNTPETSTPEENRHDLDEIPDGVGCTEIWEHLSQERDE